MKKDTLEEIEKRFDNDVERFSNLETGQTTTVDSRHNMDLITDCISRIYKSKINLLDIGCGAGNYTVLLLQKIAAADVTLLDLSQPMLNRATMRIRNENKGSVQSFKGDFRKAELKENSFDVIIATAALHHLREDADWENSFKKIFGWLKPGGSFWVFDLVNHSNDLIQDFMYNVCYKAYLTSLKDEALQNRVFSYIEHEDSPRSLEYQMNLLARVGFKSINVLHKNICFASYVAFK